MFQTIVIIILIGIIIYLILDKKNIKTNDIKNYVKELMLKIKTKLSKVTEKLTILFGKMKESIKSHHEKMKQQQAEAKLRREFERQEKESNTFEEKQDFDMKNQTQPVEKVKVVKKYFKVSTHPFHCKEKRLICPATLEIESFILCEIFSAVSAISVMWHSILCAVSSRKFICFKTFSFHSCILPEESFTPEELSFICFSVASICLEPCLCSTSESFIF